MSGVETYCLTAQASIISDSNQEFPIVLMDIRLSPGLMGCTETWTKVITELNISRRSCGGQLERWAPLKCVLGPCAPL